MKKVICFSLWGSDERYTHGAIHNAELAKEIYPGWVCRFYVGTTTPADIIEKLSENDNVEIVKMEQPGDWTSTIWRFSAASDKDVEVMVSRDCDSRLWHREKAAVEEWLASDKSFHIMRDHPYHGVPILAGMWGVKGDALETMTRLANDYDKRGHKQTDQDFLAASIYPIVKSDSIVHDEFFEHRPFPTKRDPKHFVGQAYAGCGKILDDEDTFQNFMKRCKDEGTC
jgi:hypothetical protein